MRGVTHGGPFQADELLCWLILRILYPDLQLTRTFDRAIIEAAWMAWDISGIYNHLLRRYDHHQADGLQERRRANGIPRAALGLIWLHYGERFVTPYAVRFGVSAERLARQIDRNLIEALDAADSGERDGGFSLAGTPTVSLRAYTLTEIVEAMNPHPPIDECGADDYDRAFFAAAEKLWPIFEAIIISEASKLRAAEEVERQYTSGEILVLEANCDFRDAVSEPGLIPIVYVVFPLAPDRWAVQAVGIAPGSQTLRRPLPKSWAGLAGQTLRSLTSVQDAIAVSSTGFRGTSLSRAGAIRLAELALGTN